MPLTERTERALEACHDAILAPTQWSSALQSLAESFGAASCTFYQHDRENSPAPVPMSVGHEASRPLAAQPSPCSRSAHRTVPSKMHFIHKSGLGLSPRTRPLDGGRTQNAALFPGNGASRETRMACNVLFFGRGWRLVLPDLSRRRSRPVHAGRRRPSLELGPTSPNLSVWPRSLPRSRSRRNSQHSSA